MRFEIESWIWYAFAVGMIVVRLISRTILFRTPKGLQYDDWIMGIVITGCYTALIVMSNIEAKAQSNLLPPGFDTNTLTLEDISKRAYGSKIVIVVEQMQIAVIWSCKVCLLILYHRITESVAPTHHRAIRLLAVYVALSFIVMEVLYFSAWCRPFHEYWAVPARSSQCTALTNHRITNAVFNISSDLIMLCIALPLFVRSLLPMKRKLILCCIFGLGTFVILAAVLNKYYSFMKPYEPTWIIWYTRESSTAILVANLPFTWTLLRKIFNLGAFDADHPPPPTYHSSRTAGGRRTARTALTNNSVSIRNSNEKQQESKGSNSLSLIGSVCTSREERLHAQHAQHQHQLSDTTNSDHGLLSEAIHPHDFAPALIFNTDDIDLEQAMTITPMTTIPYQQPQHLAPRPVSPVPSRRTAHSVQLSADGTGGYIALPRRVHLHHGNSMSRASSVASSVRRPMSAQSTREEGAGSIATASIGTGGRSAKDRRKRARLSS